MLNIVNSRVCDNDTFSPPIVMAAQSSDSCRYDLEAAGKFWEPYKGDFWGCLEHLTVVGGFGGILRAVGVHG